MWHISTVEYYSAIKKEQIWVRFSQMDEPRACYTVWSQKQKDFFYINKKSQKCHTMCLYHFRISFAPQRMEKVDGSEVQRDVRVCSPFQPHFFTPSCHDFKPPQTFDMLVPLPGMPFPLWWSSWHFLRLSLNLTFSVQTSWYPLLLKPSDIFL